jgi:hypothetical protein
LAEKAPNEHGSEQQPCCPLVQKVTTLATPRGPLLSGGIGSSNRRSPLRRSDISGTKYSTPTLRLAGAVCGWVCCVTMTPSHCFQILKRADRQYQDRQNAWSRDLGDVFSACRRGDRIVWPTDQGRDCRAAEIQRIAENAPRWSDMNLAAEYVSEVEAPFAEGELWPIIR